MIYTQCPGCKTIYRVSVKELRSGRGEMMCQECQIAFNALNSLAEKPKEAINKGTRPDRLPVLDIHHAIPIDSPRSHDRDETETPPLPNISAVSSPMAKRYVDWSAEDDILTTDSPSLFGYLAWGLGSLVLAGMLLLQVFAFEGEQLLQNPEMRPWLDLACDTFKCTLPDFRASSEIQIVNRSLRPTSDDTDGLEFSLVMANQSPLPQAFPAIKLSLTGSGGQILQARIFRPEEYLSSPSPHRMPVGKPFPIQLLLAKPEAEVSGFIFDLI